jgi:hypothetical protein
MAQRDLIDDYRAALLSRLPRKSQVDDVIDEVEDHLRSAVESLIRLGNDPDTAQRLTLTRFGDPTVVARAYATTSSGGLCMPTSFTRSSGYFAIAAAFAWVAAGLFAVVGQTSLVTEFSEFKYLVWAMLIMGASTATFVALVGLLLRAGVAGDWRAWLAIALLLVGGLMIGVFAWFWPVGGVLLALAALIIVLRARAAALPVDSSTWLLVLAFPLGAGVFLGLRALQLGPTDEYGDDPVGFVVGIVVATLLFAAGLLRLGRWLSREALVDGSDRAVGAPLA